MEAYYYRNIPCPPVISVRLTEGRILDIGVSILVLAIVDRILIRVPVKGVLAVGVLILVIALILSQSMLSYSIDRVHVKANVS